MAAITFRTVVNDEQIIRPPAGVVLPPGALEVTVQPIADSAVSSAERETANLRLRQHRVSLGHATDMENEAIDADLARAYGTGLNTP